MTNEEAIKIIEVARAEVEWEYPMEYAAAFDKAVEALEKQIPKKLNKSECGICGVELKLNDCLNDGQKISFCPICGQLLDWSDEE